MVYPLSYTFCRITFLSHSLTLFNTSSPRSFSCFFEFSHTPSLTHLLPPLQTPLPPTKHFIPTASSTPPQTTTNPSSSSSSASRFNNLNPITWFSRRSNAEKAVAKYAGGGGAFSPYNVTPFFIKIPL